MPLRAPVDHGCLTVQVAQDEEVHWFRVSKKTPLWAFDDHYNRDSPLQRWNLLINGQRANPHLTLEDYEMEDEDVIDAIRSDFAASAALEPAAAPEPAPAAAPAPTPAPAPGWVMSDSDDDGGAPASAPEPESQSESEPEPEPEPEPADGDLTPAEEWARIRSADGKRLMRKTPKKIPASAMRWASEQPRCESVDAWVEWATDQQYRNYGLRGTLVRAGIWWYLNPRQYGRAALVIAKYPSIHPVTALTQMRASLTWHAFDDAEVERAMNALPLGDDPAHDEEKRLKEERDRLIEERKQRARQNTERLTQIAEQQRLQASKAEVEKRNLLSLQVKSGMPNSSFVECQTCPRSRKNLLLPRLGRRQWHHAVHAQLCARHRRDAFAVESDWQVPAASPMVEAPAVFHRTRLSGRARREGPSQVHVRRRADGHLQAVCPDIAALSGSHGFRLAVRMAVAWARSDACGAPNKAQLEVIVKMADILEREERRRDDDPGSRSDFGDRFDALEAKELLSLRLVEPEPQEQPEPPPEPPTTGPRRCANGAGNRRPCAQDSVRLWRSL